MRNLREEGGDLSGVVIGAAIEVHRTLGAGFLESVYESALAVEFQNRGILFERQKIISVTYKGHSIGESRLDFFVENTLVVELKAVSQLTPLHEAQALSYLKATDRHLALLINFNVTRLKNGIKRIIRST